jgi:hypothetical protein
LYIFFWWKVEVLSFLPPNMEGKAKGGRRGKERERKECIPENLGLRRETFSFRCGCHKIRSQNVLLEESGTTPCMRNGGGWGLGRKEEG